MADPSPALPPVDREALRSLLRERLAEPELDYASPPEHLASGGEARIDAFRLCGVAPRLAGPLVLRRLFVSKPRDQLRFEAAVQNALVDQGFPVPAVLCVEPDPSALGAPFLVAERIPGEIMLLAVTRPAELARRPHRLPGIVADALFRVPEVLGRTQARLHALAVEPLRARLAAEGLSPEALGFDARLVGIRQRVEGGALDGLAPGLAWLEAHRPRQRAAVVCHGDLVFTNLCVHEGSVAGVFDWAMVTLAEPAFDVVATLARLESRLPGLPGWLDWLTRRVQGQLARRYLASYRRNASHADLGPARLVYYEAFWILHELAWSGSRLRAGAAPEAGAESRWLHDETIDVGVSGFRERTGITLEPLRYRPMRR